MTSVMFCFCLNNEMKMEKIHCTPGIKIKVTILNKSWILNLNFNDKEKIGPVRPMIEQFLEKLNSSMTSGLLSEKF